MDFWKNGINKFGGNNAHDLSNSTALTNSMNMNMNMDHSDADAYADQTQDPGSATQCQNVLGEEKVGAQRKATHVLP